MKARIVLGRIEPAAHDDARIVEVYWRVVYLACAVIVDDSEALAHRSGRQLFIAHPRRHIVADEHAGTGIEGIDFQRPFRWLGNPRDIVDVISHCVRPISTRNYYPQLMGC